MFRRKPDVDKHVASILSRKKDEKERNSQGFQIARLYADIKEYATAKRYLSNFLHVRENFPQAHQLMGEINEALGLKELAVENYKKALSLGSFGSSNRQLILKICELYSDLGTDVERLKYWCDQCEKWFPKSDVVFRMKAQIAEAHAGQNGGKDKEIEDLLVSELVNRPTDWKLRIKLLNMYVESRRYEEAYDAAVSADLTSAHFDCLPWYECLQAVFQQYQEKCPSCKTEVAFNQHYLHVLRNVVYLGMGSKQIDECSQNLQKFDQQLKEAISLTFQEEAWLAFLREMKGQMFYLAGILLLKRAQTGAISWKEINQLCGACFLASRAVEPLDSQSAWFVRTPQNQRKFLNWWYLQSYDRMSQVGHLLQKLSHNDVVDWSKGVRQHTMTAVGHQRVFKALFAPRDMQAQGQVSFFYQASEMVDNTELKEPLSVRHMIDIDRVASQVHLGSLSHLVWLCLQRYSYNMNAQPNYHFSLHENIQFSVKSLDSGAAESLCQLDILVFLIAAVRCAASAVSGKSSVSMLEEYSGQPDLLPACLTKPLCTPDQEEWWTAAYKFCTNTVKDEFNRLRRVLIRGIETVRLIGAHGVSVSLMAHIARSLDAKVKSLRRSEYGCRCPVFELTALESRAAFYWEKTKAALERLQKNQNAPLPKNCLFKDSSNIDLSSHALDTLLAEANFALSLVAMNNGQLETALEGFESHKSPWAKFYCAKIYKILAEREDEGEEDSEERSSRRQALILKARDRLHEVMDRLSGDKSHELNVSVLNELDDLEQRIRDFELGDFGEVSSSFHTPIKSPSGGQASFNGNGRHFSTPRNPVVASASHTSNGVGPSESVIEANDGDFNVSSSLTGNSASRPRPSPERLDSQIRSLSYSQGTLIKSVLDRNEELIMLNGKMMEEVRDNNTQLKFVRTENKELMEEVKAFLGENREMMKQIKTVLTEITKQMKQQAELNLRSNIVPPAGPPVPPAPPLFMPHMPAQPPRGAYPGFPPQGPVVPPAYNSYMVNSPVTPQTPNAGPQYRPTGLPGSRSSNVGKYRPQSEEEEEEEEDLSNVDEASAIYRELFESDPSSYTQYFTPESQMLQDWSMGGRSGMEAQPPMPLPPLQPRMNMPAPGYFASALRGQSLQYAQTSQTPGQIKPVAPGPGFFSTPAAVGVTAPGAVRMPTAPASNIPGASMLATGPAPAADSTQSPALMAALTGQKAVPAVGSPTAAVPVTAGTNIAGIQLLFQAKATLEPKKTKGDVSVIVDTTNNYAALLMTSDAKELLLHHDISTLKLEPSFVGTSVIWTAVRVGQTEREKVTLTVEPAGVATHFKEALQKAASMLFPKPTGQATPVQAPAVSTPKLFGNLPATSTPIAATTTAATGATTASKDAGKFSLGGITFSSTPTISPTADTERPKAEAHKPPTISKSDASKPFASFSLTPTSTVAKPEFKFAPLSTSDTGKSGADKTQSPFASQKSPGTVTKSQAEAVKGGAIKSPGGEDDHVEEYEPNVDFKPVIALPELVEKKTGEENETEIFVERSRLFRFDQEAKQWKERGVGEMKILRSKDQVRFRIIMRREQILKLCANHFLTAEMRLTPMASSDRAWCYSAADFSEEEMKIEQLAFKFKNAEKAKAFQEVFNDCCRLLKEEQAKGAGGSTGGEDKTVAAADSTTSKGAAASPKTTPPSASFGAASTSASDTKPLSELFKPKAGSWECSGCLVRNSEGVIKCPACGTAKPGSKPALFGGAAAATAPAPTTQSLSELFKPKAGSWECDGCLVRNNADIAKCPACGTLKPGAKAEDVPKDKPSTGFSFGAKIAEGSPGTGFKFGAATTSSTVPLTGGFTFTSSPATSGTSGTPGGFKFGAATTSAPTSTSQPTGFVFKPTASTVTTTAATETTKAAATSSSGTQGFTFKPTQPAAAIATTTTSAMNVGFTFTTSTAAAAKLGSKIGATTTTAAATTTSGGVSSTSTPPTFGFSTAPKPTGFTFGTPTKDSSTDGQAAGQSGLLAKLLTAEDGNAEMKILGGASSTATTTTKPATGFNFTMPAKSTAHFGGAGTTSTASSGAASSSQGFQFSFTKSPPKSQQGAPVVPSSPEVDEHGMYVNKEGDDSHIHFEPVVNLPDKVEVKTGEEDEDILFESRGKMYRFVAGEWKEKGLGVVKILQHKETKKTRVLMRRDQVLKICCNHRIEPSLKLQPMAKTEGKAWVWYAHDFSEDDEGKMEQLALRFRTADIAGEFKKVFDQCRDTATASPSPGKGEASTPEAKGDTHTAKKELFKADSTSDDNDVIFVGEDKPTAEQIAKARKFQLPDTFYLYEKKPPCPGCIGCGDGEMPAVVSPTSKSHQKESPKSKGKETGQQETTVFGVASNLPDFASLTSDGPSDSKDGANGGFLFGSSVNVDFSSLAASGQSQDYVWKKTDSTGPFKFAGAGQRLFGSGGGGGGEGDDGDDSGVIPSNDVHFEPVIPLPDLVEVKTGEEEWTALFCQRAKLYKFDKDASQWKERGIGEIKIMSHNAKTMYRVLQRREQVLKVACNHLISPDMQLKAMASSETSWCWVAEDFTDQSPSVERFAVKFKTQEIAKQFKKVFEECQEILRNTDQDQERPVPETMSSSHQSSLGRLQPGPEVVTARQQTPLGDKGNVYHTKALDVAGQDTMMPASYTPLGDKDVHESMTSAAVTPLGDRGNVYHTKALDVAGQDAMVSASYTPLGDKDVEESMSAKAVTPLGDKGNIYHTQALNVAGQDTITRASYTPPGDKDVQESMTSKAVTPLGDKGNVYHTQALTVAGADTITPASYTPLGDRDAQESMSSNTVTPLGDRGNIYHTKALDVAGQDTMVSGSYTPLGDKDVPDSMTAKTMTPLGDRGNVYHTKALNVAGQDTMAAASYTPLGDRDVQESMTAASVTPLGDKGNVYHTQALDVAGADTMVPTSYTPLGDKDAQDAMKFTSVTPLGDKGNVYHTKALDVAGQDTMVPTSYTPLGGKDVQGSMTAASVTPLGDKGNVYHTQALNVAGQDTMVSASYKPLSGKDIYESMAAKTVTPLGDKGNIHHTQALNVAGADTITPASYTPLGGKDVQESMAAKTVTPLGDKGNVYHTQALNVAGQDTMVSATHTPLGSKDVHESMKSASVTPLGDKGNVHHTKALNVAGQDTMASSSYTPLGGKDVHQSMKSTSMTPLGDKGNVHHTQALNVAGADTITPASYTPLGGKDGQGSMMAKSVTPLGDKGNVHHTQALNVAGADTITPASFTPLGDKNVQGSMKSTSVTPLGDKGNVHHTQALNVAGADTITPASFTPLSEKNVQGSMAAKTVTPLGDKGNVHHAKALDVAGQDTMAAATYSPLSNKDVQTSLTAKTVTPLGDKGNVHHTQALNVAGADTITPASFSPLGDKNVQGSTKSTSVTPLGDKGNVHHTKALDVAGADVMTPSSYTPLSDKAAHGPMTATSVTPLGDKGNVHHTQALNVAGADTITPASFTPLSNKNVQGSMKSSSVTPLGDKGNVHHTQALDVAGQDTMAAATYTPLSNKDVQKSIAAKTITPLGDKGNVHHTQALNVAGADTITPASFTPLSDKNVQGSMAAKNVTPLGDKGNVHHTKALDVAGQDTMAAATYTPLSNKDVQTSLAAKTVTPLGDKGNVHHTQALNVAGADTITSASFTPLSERNVQGSMAAKNVTPLGDKGNVHHTQALNVAGADVMTPSSYTPLSDKAAHGPMTAASVTPLGDKGNVHHTQALNVAGADIMTPSSYTPLSDKVAHGPMTATSVTPLGDKGNIHHTQALNVSAHDETKAASYAQQGDKGNPYHSHALSQLGQDTPGPSSAHGSLSHSPHTPHSQATGGAGFAGPKKKWMQQSVAAQGTGQQQGATPQQSQQQQQTQQQQQQQPQQRGEQSHQAEASYEDDDEDDEDDEYDDEDDEEEKVLFEKRATLSSHEDGTWKKIGMGDLRVTYNEDVNGNEIHFMTDSGEKKCSHIITKELNMTYSQRTCEWRPLDYATDEAIRRHFQVTFSSIPAAEEFAKHFYEGQRLAKDSDLSENIPSEIDVPEIFSGGDGGY